MAVKDQAILLALTLASALHLSIYDFKGLIASSINSNSANSSSLLKLTFKDLEANASLKSIEISS